ncbi:MAG: radical SAM protein [Candidatus Thorarchaeota archaeon]|nr:MAG: radical SAM protein [Candidatus Thorarchaeota archaeon]
MKTIEKVRLSIGTAIQLGLERGNLIPDFTSAFLMTYCETGCRANCAFCPQARESTSALNKLSRISWPVYDFQNSMSSFNDSVKFQRICIQCLNYQGVADDTVYILTELRKHYDGPISVCIHPLQSTDLRRLRDSGATNIGIAIDAATPAIFNQIKGEERDSDYRWETHRQALSDAVEVFGDGNVTTHLIVGLGETEREASEFLIEMFQQGICVGLFAFTSVRGTSLEGESSPDLGSYRRLQILRHLLSQGVSSHELVEYNETGELSFSMEPEKLEQSLATGQAFRVSGCSGCNRPYYNERPGGTSYNFPRTLSENEVKSALEVSGVLKRDG